MMFDTGHAFGVIARAAEEVIHTSGLQARRNRRDVERWIAHKNVSHFNLHQCFESFIKCIRAIERTPTPNLHPLARLFDGLSHNSANALDGAWKETVGASGERAIALCFSPTPPEPIASTQVRCLRDMLAHWDGPFGLHRKRYQWEQAGRGQSMQFMDDMTPHFRLMDRIEAHVARTLQEEHASRTRS